MSSVEIRQVTVVGGTGGIGQPIVQELVEQGFQVSILSRGAGNGKVPEGVTVKTVNYDDIESLKAALTGQDAVVSTIASAAVGDPQQKLADAAFAVGIKRFVPSEFGINTRKLQGLEIGKIVAGKTHLVDDLQKKAEERSDFSWTGISNGLFFDLNLELGIFGFDAKQKTATIVDSGNEPFQTSNKGLIAKAVASVLKHPQETANKYLSIASFQPTLNQILEIVEAETGSKWTVERQSTADLQKIGEEKLAKGDFSAFGPLLRVHLYRDGEGHALKEGEKANALLGLPENEDIKETLRKWLASTGAI
ncbi:NAD(P)-binding protein [Cryphonectria parasitica EP155]|uniref:NAD(P)-binding protein n=1 Tax=Cryphonectria parasitica (strain ATCC 38755 / EP155) TaxID=660469 RepID=A0A9P4XWA1_CRYP1|nr:NAD(P)-binding protein [Cryphonectria parasitica EP155]KAF3762134.1 NAD(P)-binding protein [Cryphonectria parasitica EP155]